MGIMNIEQGILNVEVGCSITLQHSKFLVQYSIFARSGCWLTIPSHGNLEKTGFHVTFAVPLFLAD
jgi:hypothetical protein